MALLVRIGGFHVEAGLRTFSAWSMRMVHDVGDWVRPYLSDVWERVGDYPEILKSMQPRGNFGVPATKKEATRDNRDD